MYTEKEVAPMTDSEGKAKAQRLLTLYSWFKEGRIVKKPDAARHFQIAERSIQRDLEELRCFFAEQTPQGEIVYDPKNRGYYLATRDSGLLSNSEALAVCKILLESRSMVKSEMLPILDKLISSCVPEENKSAVLAMLANEKYHYIEPHHQKPVLPVYGR